MAATDAKVFAVKNQALRIYFYLFKTSDNTLLTGAAGLDSEIVKDGANLVDCTNEATETSMPGYYFLDLTAAEMNFDNVGVQVKSTLGFPVCMSIMTGGVAAIQSGLATSASQANQATSAAVAAVQADTDDIQSRLPSTLSGGRMRSVTESMSADVVNASAVAADAGAEIATAIWDGFSVSEPAAGALVYPTTPRIMLSRLFQKFFARRTMTTGGVETQRNAADTASLWTQQHTNDGTTYVQGKAT